MNDFLLGLSLGIFIMMFLDNIIDKNFNFGSWTPTIGVLFIFFLVLFVRFYG